MGFWGTLGKIGGIVGGIAGAPFTGGASLIPTVLSAGGAALGGIAEAQAKNRGTQAEVGATEEQLRQAQENQFFQQMLAREVEGRNSRNDAMRGLQQSEYLSNWKPSTSSLSPHTRQLQGPSDVVRQGASSMRDDMLRRIAGNVMPEVTRPKSIDLPGKKAGFFEKFAGVASPALTLLGNLPTKKAK